MAPGQQALKSFPQLQPEHEAVMFRFNLWDRDGWILSSKGGWGAALPVDLLSHSFPIPSLHVGMALFILTPLTPPQVNPAFSPAGVLFSLKQLQSSFFLLHSLSHTHFSYPPERSNLHSAREEFPESTC
jgi:hypothetical protein